MGERDSLMRGSVFTAGGASIRGSGWSGLVHVVLAGLRLLGGGSAACFRRRANGDFRPIQQLVKATHRNHFLRLKTLDGSHGSIRRTGDNCPHGSSLITLDHVGKGPLGIALNCRSRNQSHIVLRVDEQLHVHELTRKKSVVSVVKDGFEFQSSGGRV